MDKQRYSCRDEEIRVTMSFDEVARRIKNYGVEYDPNLQEFDAWNQLLACESLAESKTITPYTTRINNSAGVSGMINGAHKQGANFELTESRQKVISALSTCNYQTSPRDIALLLEEFFKECSSKDGHWLFVAQQWNPRAINRTISELIKLHLSGKKTIQNPAAYFTYLIKFRKKRRS